MNLVDIIALALIIFGSIHGFIRGLSGELSHLLSILGAFIFGLWCREPLAVWFQENTRLTEQPAQALAFAITILTALIILLCLRYFLNKIMKIVIEEPFNRVGGAIAGFLRATLIIIIIFIFMNLIPHEYMNQKFGDESLVGSLIKPHIPNIEEQVEKHIKK
jgi:uncharacterized membrane protein required for colicin V production